MLLTRYRYKFPSFKYLTSIITFALISPIISDFFIIIMRLFIFFQWGNTALLLAISMSNVDAARILLEKKANIKAKNNVCVTLYYSKLRNILFSLNCHFEEEKEEERKKTKLFYKFKLHRRERPQRT